MFSIPAFTLLTLVSLGSKAYAQKYLCQLEFCSDNPTEISYLDQSPRTARPSYFGVNDAIRDCGSAEPVRSGIIGTSSNPGTCYAGKGYHVSQRITRLVDKI